MIDDNGFDPLWDETFQFKLEKEELNFLVVKVFDRDGTKTNTLLCWNAIPIHAMRCGVRNV